MVWGETEKEKLIRLLKDPEVQREIRGIVQPRAVEKGSERLTADSRETVGLLALLGNRRAGGSALPLGKADRETGAEQAGRFPGADRETGAEQAERLQRELAAQKQQGEEQKRQLEQIVERLRQEKTAAEQGKAKAEDTARQTWARCEQLVAGLTAEQGKSADLQEQLTVAQGQNTALRTEREQLRKKLRQKQDELTALMGKNERLKKENGRQLEKNKQLMDELRERFDAGWRLYHQYAGLRADYRQQLSGVFVTGRGFEGFICGGAQDDSLKKLWEVLRRAVKNGDKEEAALLEEIFEYVRKLVNCRRETELYVRLETEQGEAYDIDCHEAMTSSRAQGSVAERYLDGYRNTYNNRVEGKSLVRIG